MSWVNYARDVVLISVTLHIFGVSLWFVIPITIIGFFATVCIGFADLKWGIWIEEVRYSNLTLNPVIAQMSKDITELKEVKEK